MKKKKKPAANRLLEIYKSSGLRYKINYFMSKKQANNDNIDRLTDTEIKQLLKNQKLPKGNRAYGNNQQWPYLSNHKAIIERMEVTGQSQKKQ